MQVKADFKSPLPCPRDQMIDMNMKTFDMPGTADDNAFFSSLRNTLADEVSSSAMLADLLQKVNRMQDSHKRPDEFKVRFDEFVVRAEDYMCVVGPFFPTLVRFLSLHRRVEELVS
jgi:hypothetical protein